MSVVFVSPSGLVTLQDVDHIREFPLVVPIRQLWVMCRHLGVHKALENQRGALVIVDELEGVKGQRDTWKVGTTRISRSYPDVVCDHVVRMGVAPRKPGTCYQFRWLGP